MSNRPSNAELREAIDKYFWPAPFSGTGHPLQVTISGGVENHVFTMPYSAFVTAIEAIFQAREQHPSTSRGYMMGFKAGQQQLLTELLGELPEKVGYFVETEPELSVSQQKIFGDGYNQAINQVVSIIERYREGLR